MAFGYNFHLLMSIIIIDEALSPSLSNILSLTNTQWIYKEYTGILIISVQKNCPPIMHPGRLFPPSICHN